MTSKRLKEIINKVESDKIYPISDALNFVKENSTCKFDETVEVKFKLNVDPKHADQNIRQSLVLPAGLGKTFKVAVVASGDKVEDAKNAGADFYGSDDLVTEISSGFLDFDCCISTPDMMVKVGKLGKILGPKGLMPNPKLGTVTTDVVTAVKNAKYGQVEVKTDKYGIVHAPIGKASFKIDDLQKNFDSFYEFIKQIKPQTVKGIYIKSIFIKSTMGPALKLQY
ncbi:MAG: 50S ribosomal protein L1 [Rickettsiales bacterium]|nr:50S ribosomal protein L1 [Rickettsiales bacterium]